jgi:hypothetical protein
MSTTNRFYRPGASAGIKPSPGNESTPTGQPDGLSEPPPFPMESLPTAAREMAQAIAIAEGTPPTLAGVCCLGILSASLGRGLQIQSGADRVSRGNLFIVGSAESGSGKSETYRHAARPFNEYEHRLVDDWRQNVQHQIGSEVTMLGKELARLEKAAGGDNQSAIEREELRQRIEAKQARLAQASADNHAPCLQVEDTTTEKLAALLAANGEHLASLSSDAGTIVSNLLGRYNSTGRTDESIYLKAWSGDGFRVDRLGREPVSLTSPCLAALWLVQKDKVDSLLEVQSLSDGGLIPRLLVCHSKAEAQRIEGSRPGIPTETAAAWAELINTLLDTYHRASEPLTIQPADDALAALVGYHNAIVDRRKADLSDVGSFAARWAEQAWRIGVCLHAGRHGASAGERQLGVDTALAAIRLAEWFSEQQLAILGGVREAGKRAVRDEVLALLADTPTGIRAADVYRRRIVTTAAEAHSLLATMETEGTLAGTDSKPDGGGHVTRTFKLARN